MQDERRNGEAYVVADEEFAEIKDLARRVKKEMGINVCIPYFSLLPLVFGEHICKKVCTLGRIARLFVRAMD